MKDIEVCASTTYEKQHKKPRNWEKYEYEKCKINYKHITTHMPYILCWSDMKLDFYVKEFFVVVKGRLEENCIHSLKKYIYSVRRVYDIRRIIYYLWKCICCSVLAGGCQNWRHCCFCCYLTFCLDAIMWKIFTKKKRCMRFHLQYC